MKVWKDACEIKMVHELNDRKLRELDIEMRKKPKFDKVKSEGNYGNDSKKKRRFDKCKKEDL